ncbi:MAG: 1-deoxy-D-xylulose-5-phosphate synthase [Anaerovoracaceae bacterium]
MTKKLIDYDFPSELKNMTNYELELLSYDIRDFLIGNISKTGGHLASNLGIVELTIALHKVFNTPEDKLTWDVGHQTYVHKILTGRAKEFSTLRKFGGMSGFPKVKDSPYDTFDTGHSSTSISSAAGIAAARDLSGELYKVAAIIGDGALTGGLAYEALNNVGVSKTNVIVILNDNGMSISPNTGGVSKYLGRLRSSSKYTSFKKAIKQNLSKIPVIGNGMVCGMQHMRDSLKYAVLDGIMFEELGFKYFGPVDGHDIQELTKTLELAKEVNGPVFVHVITKKGKGYRNAEMTPSKFHGTGPFNPTTGIENKIGPKETYSSVFGNKLLEMATKNKKILAVSAAMIEGTGLESFQRRYPKRVFDVGIAEAHGVTFAAGLARQGYKPVVAIYSTFLQRSYDQIMEDVCLQNLPVVFGIDRAGIVGADGETHHGIFDLSYLSHMPNMTIMSPMDKGELEAMMEYAMTLPGPCAIRYPKGQAFGASSDRSLDNGSYVIKEGKDVEIWAIGNMANTGLTVCQELKKMNIDAGLVNGRFVKPLDIQGLQDSANRTKLIITLEDNVLSGGFGQAIKVALSETNTPVENIGWPDKFIEHGSCDELYHKYGLDRQGITERICESIERQTGCSPSK